MGLDFFLTFAEAAQIFKRADDALGFSLTDLCFEGPEEELNKTANTQPAVLTTSIACLEVFRRAGAPVPSALAGHSLGEYTALVAAGSLSFEDAVRLVRKRGQYMQEAVPLGTGGMAAVMGLSGAEAVEVCRRASAEGVVEAVNLNCPGQVVVAGDLAGLKAAQVLAKEAGAKRFVRTGSEVRESLIKQVYSPVRWEESIRRLISDGVNTFIEIGPGKVLSGLIKKISREVKICNIEDQASLEKVLALQGEVS